MPNRLQRATEHLELAKLLRERDDFQDPAVREQYVGHLQAARGAVGAAIDAHERSGDLRRDGDSGGDE